MYSCEFVAKIVYKVLQKSILFELDFFLIGIKEVVYKNIVIKKYRKKSIVILWF